MSISDCLPDYPVKSDFVNRLKSALEARDEATVRDLICTEVRHVDAVIELANDDWMKDPSAQLPPGVLLGDLDRLKLLMDQFFQDANVVFEIKKDEMEWQVKSPATFGPSGLWTLEYKRELTTPLCIAAARGHTACQGGHTACAQLLLQHRADPDLLSADGLAPLHLCRTAASLGCAQALLEHGASVQYGGASPLARVLHTAACAPEAAPQRTLQALLNHGSPTVWPDAFPKVLKTCAPAPAVLEVLFNSYPQLRVSESWKEVIPEEVFQMHQPFYQSLFALAYSPRCLQHLCRCAIRKLFGRKCFYLVPQLPLPKPLQNYLLLEPEGVLH
ncbi:ankyrin repeat and SOCS box protein 18 [Neophocaena asiaeorientalis asiaeorientalis]|uniref:Ankyrin repeat and SOCS box protein 18 n=1 Tax=Neophocaena asiaeorientalis asiaeorientalis TaxID=1706337 RepID=A0A341C131_NEOAA|nr:ankyrin repeat and SOCS box protein 18 [Neophocaena asiaeorientalis asiaeorientalis]